MKLRISLLICAALSISSIYAQDFEYSFKENYEVSLPAQLAVSSSDGNLDIIPSEGNKILVFYIVKKANKVLKINREELAKELIVDVVHANNSLKISVKNKNLYRSFTVEFPMNVHFKVYVPRETSCDLHTSDGNISFEGLVSNQRCKTSDGNIDIANIMGNVTGGTSDGNIYVKDVKGFVEVGTSDGNIEFERIKGDVQASTSDGNIKLDRVNGNIGVKTSDGYISFHDISGSFKASTSDGSIKGNVVELKEQLTLKTSGGNIDVTIPSQLGLDLDIKGESIDVPVKNFSGKFDKTFVRGQSNGGGIPVVLSTSDGNVTLNY